MERVVSEARVVARFEGEGGGLGLAEFVSEYVSPFFHASRHRLLVRC
jgi:hypothetical protein